MTSGLLILSTPSEFDVLCGRDKQSFGHPGNQRFREIVQQQRDVYQQARKRADKNAITKRVIGMILEKGIFLKLVKGGGWTPLDDDEVYEKVSHALRGAKSLGKKGEKRDQRRKSSKLSTPPPELQAIMHSSFNEIRARQKLIFQNLLLLHCNVTDIPNVVSDGSSCCGSDDATLCSRESQVAQRCSAPASDDEHEGTWMDAGLQLDPESDFELFDAAEFFVEV